MTDKKQKHENIGRSMHTLAMVNVVIWALAIIAMVVVMERGSPVRGMFPILAGGVAVGVAQISAIQRFRRQA